MRRSRTLPDTRERPDPATIIHHIASFLTLSDSDSVLDDDEVEEFEDVKEHDGEHPYKLDPNQDEDASTVLTADGFDREHVELGWNRLQAIHSVNDYSMINTNATYLRYHNHGDNNNNNNNNNAATTTTSAPVEVVGSLPSLSGHVDAEEWRHLLCTDEEESWAVGRGLDSVASLSSCTAPPTPAVIAISPVLSSRASDHPLLYETHDENENLRSLQHNGDHLEVLRNNQDAQEAGVGGGDHARNDFRRPSQSNNRKHYKQRRKGSPNDDGRSMEEVLRKHKRRWAQEKIIAAVFGNMQPLRSYCLEAYLSAQRVRQKKQLTTNEEADTMIIGSYVGSERCLLAGVDARFELLDMLTLRVPISILGHCGLSVGFVALDSTTAVICIAGNTVHGGVSLLGSAWDFLWHINPLSFLDALISLQFNAMGRTSEALASGIQSVATGVGSAVGSASSMALQRLAITNAQTSAGSIGNPAHHQQQQRRMLSHVMQQQQQQDVNQKLLQKLSSINDAAPVLSYEEYSDDTGGLTKQAISRARRMMHYSVSLRPFRATVAMAPPSQSSPSTRRARKRLSASERDGSVTEEVDGFDEEDFSVSSEDSPFMCTPQSFPPTPHSRQMVMAQKTRFSDDVVFFARDRLRIHGGLESDNERTREMARALREGERLAVFDAACTANGIQLSCGQHVATKVGNMYYSSARSMVPILRNCFVYFEITILPPSVSHGPLPLHSPAVTLSIGLSTEEMPPDTLVGAWQGSIGLCTTGQVLMAGQWWPPSDPLLSSYGAGTTVGCLVCMDDASAYETWDGLMVYASVTFSINGRPMPPVVTLPAAGPPPTAIAFPSKGSSQGMGVHDMMMGVVPPNNDKFPSATLPPLTNGVATQPFLGPNTPADATVTTLLVPAAEDLYPTVTLQSGATSVMGHFSSEDVVAASSHEAIGAPPHVAVYAVDGSVIFPGQRPQHK